VGDALGSVQGRKAQGFRVQQLSTFWRGPRGGVWEQRKRGRRTFQGGSFAPLSQQNVTGPHLGWVFSNAEYVGKVGAC